MTRRATDRVGSGRGALDAFATDAPPVTRFTTTTRPAIAAVRALDANGLSAAPAAAAFRVQAHRRRAGSNLGVVVSVAPRHEGHDARPGLRAVGPSDRVHGDRARAGTGRVLTLRSPARCL